MFTSKLNNIHFERLYRKKSKPEINQEKKISIYAAKQPKNVSGCSQVVFTSPFIF